MHQIECTVEGRVQGVFYRDTTRAYAQSNDIVGYVENMPDGTVHVVAQGTEDVLNDFISFLKEGSPAANVEQVSVTWREPDQDFSDFSVKY